ncbi:CRISPR-associated protein Cas1 [Methylobacterium nodulans ORS 2060]|uniref:CRISPR-associated endonuclease Cas1 n=1 Tax=Methylobacterium nodulans (strain LMG 21967 / CNCM I-2342 / ORS 2060) TaxID=460265 RepID=B8IMR0_METNO|nr:type I-E CRISPR-associated endonuclease Cas1e [Methylobacterium nodulans]ACL60253.1 CRISPR-associated protein Cas1 [Methylobacterium nodulans ORS 2060]
MSGASLPGLPPPKPIPIKDRASLLFVEKGQLDVLDGTFVLVDENGVRVQIPIGGLVCLMLEPGTRVSHAAVALAARAGTLLVWVGEAGVRLYAAGQPGGARADRLLWQARLALDESARLKVVRRMFELRFGEAAPERRSIDQLRGIEGARVRRLYQLYAQQNGVVWNRRAYDQGDWDASDVPNRCLSAATACLHGLAEAAVLAAGYAPAIGFLHTGRPRSFVYDVADLFKFETVVPAAFRVAGRAARGALSGPTERVVRHECRDIFRRTSLLERIIPAIEDVLAAGGLPPPDAPTDAQEPAFDEPSSGDPGHRG